jgi:hypothetical protein
MRTDGKRGDVAISFRFNGDRYWAQEAPPNGPARSNFLPVKPDLFDQVYLASFGYYFPDRFPARITLGGQRLIGFGGKSIPSLSSSHGRVACP